MTIKFSLVALMIATTAMPIHAQMVDKNLPRQAPASQDPVRGGMYQIMPQLQAVNSEQVTDTEVVAELGSQSIIAKSTKTPNTDPGKIQAGTVVKNRFSGEYGIYSGKLLVLLKKDVNFTSLQQQFGLELVKNTGESQLLVIKSRRNQDLKELSQQLKASGLVDSVRIDMLERRNIAY